MNLYVCTRLSFPHSGKTLPDWTIRDVSAVCSYDLPPNHSLSEFSVPDAILGMGVGAIADSFQAIERWPGIPFFAYNWDTYEWVWENPRPNEYDYKRYGELLAKAREIWTPSYCTCLRTKQWYGLDSKVIPSAVPFWSYPSEKIVDNGYLLCPLREIPDKNWNWFERACKELDIPYRMSKHDLSFEDYQKTVAGCRGIVSHLYEASTGGLTLMEGYYLGKPCLLSNSTWHGGKDYFGLRARYCPCTSYELFKKSLKDFYVNPPSVHRDHADYITNNFSDEKIIAKMLHRINACCSP